PAGHGTARGPSTATSRSRGGPSWGGCKGSGSARAPQRARHAAKSRVAVSAKNRCSTVAGRSPGKRRRLTPTSGPSGSADKRRAAASASPSPAGGSSLRKAAAAGAWPARAKTGSATRWIRRGSTPNSRARAADAWSRTVTSTAAARARPAMRRTAGRAAQSPGGGGGALVAPRHLPRRRQGPAGHAAQGGAPQRANPLGPGKDRHTEAVGQKHQPAVVGHTAPAGQVLQQGAAAAD